MKHAPVEISLTDTDNNPQFVLWNCQKAAIDLHTQCEELEAEIERLEAEVEDKESAIDKMRARLAERETLLRQCREALQPKPATDDELLIEQVLADARAEIERLTEALRMIQCACIMPRPGVVGAVQEISREALAKED
jgi:predicted RNase H-like nuclease (RuvC/YqgF family)